MTCMHPSSLEIMVGSSVAVQNQGTKRLDIYGVVVVITGIQLELAVDSPRTELQVPSS